MYSEISLNLHKSHSFKRQCAASNSDLAASRRRQFRLWGSFSYPQDSKTAGGNVRSEFRPCGCEPLQIPTYLKVGEGLKYGGRSGSSDTTDIKQQILIVENIKCFKKGKVKTK